MSAPRYEIPADAFTLHGTEAGWLLHRHKKILAPVLEPITIGESPSDVFTPPKSVAVCSECGEHWEEWGCPTVRAVLLVGIYEREWKKQKAVARRAIEWLAEVGSIDDWRNDPARGAVEFKITVSADLLTGDSEGFVMAALQKAHRFFTSKLKSKPSAAVSLPGDRT